MLLQAQVSGEVSDYFLFLIRGISYHFLGRLKQEINMSIPNFLRKKVLPKSQISGSKYVRDLLEFFQFAKICVFVNFIIQELKFSNMVSFWLKLTILSVLCQFHS